MVGDGWRCWQWQCLLLLSMFVDLAVAGSMCKVQQYQIIKIIRCDYSRWWLQHTKARLYRQNISPALDFTGLQAYYSILQCNSIKLQSQWWHPGPTTGSNVTQIDLRRPTYSGWALAQKTFFLMKYQNTREPENRRTLYPSTRTVLISHCTHYYHLTFSVDLSLGFRTGNLRVGFSHTVPVPDP